MKLPIRIAENLSLPLDFVTSTQAILAQKGKGKSYTASVEAEELLEASQQVVVIDPTDAWYGLRSSPDGRSTGYSIAVFGGDHGDVALEPDSGVTLAEAIVAERFSAIICTENLSTAGELKFVGEFLETLYRKNRQAVHLIVDEADIFAPQKPFGGEMKTCGAMDNIVRRGRKKGIGCTMVTQRSSVLNKNVLSQADMLVALGCSHPLDLDAIAEWVRRHADPKLAKQMMDSLPSLPRGDAWVWNPSAEIFKRVTIRKRMTFDSGATPKPGEKAAVAKVLAPVDIKRLGEKIAATVERQRENDPTALKKKIAELERELKAKPAKAPKTIEKSVIKAGDFAKLSKFSRDLEKRSEEIQRKADALAVAAVNAREAAKFLAQLGAPATVVLPGSANLPPDLRRDAMTIYSNRSIKIGAPPLPPRKRVVTDEDVFDGDSASTSLPAGERTVLAAVIQNPGIGHEQLAVLTSYKKTSRTTYLQRLGASGLVAKEGSGYVATADGVRALPNLTPLPTGAALREKWLRDLPEGERIVLSFLLDNPNGTERVHLGASTGYKKTSYTTYLQRLGARKLVEKVGSLVRPSRNLYDAGEL